MAINAITKFSPFPKLKPIRTTYWENEEEEVSTVLYIKKCKFNGVTNFMLEMVRYDFVAMRPLFIVVDYYREEEREVLDEHYEKIIEDMITSGFKQLPCNHLELN